MARTAHRIEIGGVGGVGAQVFNTVLADVYGANGSNISAQVGIRRGATTNRPTFPARALQDANYLTRLAITFRRNNRSVRALIYCRTDLVSSAKSSLIGRNYKGFAITSVRQPGRVEITA